MTSCFYFARLSLRQAVPAFIIKTLSQLWRSLMMRKSLVMAATLAGVMLSGAALAQNYRAEYRLSTVLNTAFPWGQAGERWAELVKEKT